MTDLTCKICNRTFTRYCTLSLHITHTHKITTEQYYTQYIDSSEHLCKRCGKQLKFKVLQFPYSTYCSKDCAIRSEEVKLTREKTMLTRYGVKYALQADNILAKQRDTTMARYGTDNIFSSRNFAEARKLACKQKYGVDYYCQSEDFKEKTKTTKLKKYGSETYVNADKIRQTKLTRHGSETYNNSDKMIVTKHDNMLLKYVQHYNTAECIVNNIDYVNAYCHCNLCNSDFVIQRQYLFDRCREHQLLCTVCNPVDKPYSKAEKEIVQFIVSLGVTVVENDRTVLSGHELDIYVPDYKLAIEYNGLYWHDKTHKRCVVSQNEK